MGGACIYSMALSNPENLSFMIFFLFPKIIYVMFLMATDPWAVWVMNFENVRKLVVEVNQDDI